MSLQVRELRHNLYFGPPIRKMIFCSLEIPFSLAVLIVQSDLLNFMLHLGVKKDQHC